MGAGLALEPDAVSASTSRLTELPIEILEEILLRLPNQDVIKMEAVRRMIASPDVLALTFCHVI